MSNPGFRTRLAARQKKANTLVCVGLDPLYDKVPAHFRTLTPSPAAAVLVWMQQVVDQTAGFVSLFKPQHAYWENIPGGIEALKALILFIHVHHPGIPVIIDCKRGDIDRTQKQYGETHLALEAADGMNFNGYMGRSTIASLINPEQPGRALVGLGRTSNPDAWEIQDAPMSNGRCLWQFMVEHQRAWADDLGVLEDAGIVMGAAHKHPTEPDQICFQHLVQAREIVGNDMWLLIPGIGTQGGFVEETVRYAFAGPGSIAIGASSSVIFAEDPTLAVYQLRQQILDAGGSCA